MGVWQSLTFLAIWFFVQLAWESVTNVFERIVLASYLGIVRSDPSDFDHINSRLPGPIAAAMMVWVVGSLALPWLIADTLLGWFSV